MMRIRAGFGSVAPSPERWFTGALRPKRGENGMGFIQILEYQTSRVEELAAVATEFRKRMQDSESTAKPLGGTITADRDRPGCYLSIIEFDSYESAMEASNSPDTQEFFGRLSGLMDGPPKFYNLDVVDTWEIARP
jgi:hypothetical protein